MTQYHQVLSWSVNLHRHRPTAFHVPIDTINMSKPPHSTFLINQTDWFQSKQFYDFCVNFLLLQCIVPGVADTVYQYSSNGYFVCNAWGKWCVSITDIFVFTGLMPALLHLTLCFVIIVQLSRSTHGARCCKRTQKALNQLLKGVVQLNKSNAALQWRRQDFVPGGTGLASWKDQNMSYHPRQHYSWVRVIALGLCVIHIQ